MNIDTQGKILIFFDHYAEIIESMIVEIHSPRRLGGLFLVDLEGNFEERAFSSSDSDTVVCAGISSEFSRFVEVLAAGGGGGTNSSRWNQSMGGKAGFRCSML